MEEYDVIVAGAGPAGGNCAKELAGMDYDVLLLERSKIIGEPNFSTGGTVKETMKIFNLPKKITDSSWSSILIQGPTEKAEFDYNKTMGYVLNYKLLKQFLAHKAKVNGAEVITGAIVDDVIIKNGYVNGIILNEKNERKKFFSKVVVDATGTGGVLSRRLGLTSLQKKLTIGIEYHMNKVHLERADRLNFYLNRNYAPNGYAWIFPSGKGRAKVGVGILQSIKNGRPLIEFLKRFVASHKQTASAKIIDLHGGALNDDTNVKNYVKDGFISVGDAAFQINHLGGEGIRHALYSGLFAAQTIDLALTKNDIGRKGLELYNLRWKNYIGRKWAMASILSKRVYSLNNNGFDAGIKLVSKFDPQDVFEILFNYQFGLIRKYLPQIFKTFPKYLF